MKTLPNLAAYLQKKGVNDSTPLKEVEALKKSYWQAYHKQYHQERKKNERRFTLRLSGEEYRRFTLHAKQHKSKSIGQFIKEAALAYLGQQYIPRDKTAMDTLSKSIRRISNIINQVVQSIHRTAKRKGTTGAFADGRTLEKLQREYEFLVKRVEELQKEVNGFMTSPTKRVGETLWEILSQEPDKIDQVRKLLDEIEAKTKTHAHH